MAYFKTPEEALEETENALLYVRALLTYSDTVSNTFNMFDDKYNVSQRIDEVLNIIQPILEKQLIHLKGRCWDELQKKATSTGK